MKITVTEYTDNEETHKVVVEADKANISKVVGEYVQQRVQELGLVLDYCLYLSPEGKQVRFPLALELTKNDNANLEGCPTDEEMQLMLDKEEAAQVEREHWFEHEVHENPNRNDYPPYASGRGYGDFPKEGL